MTGKPERSGPPGNHNQLRHGLHRFLATGALPKGCSYIHKALLRLRTALETAVVATHGAINIYRASLISSAVQHEGRRLLLSRWLRREAGDGDLPATITTEKTISEQKAGNTKASIEHSKQQGLSLRERMELLDRIGAAADARDRAIGQLELNRDERQSMWDRFYAMGTPARNTRDQVGQQQALGKRDESIAPQDDTAIWPMDNDTEGNDNG